MTKSINNYLTKEGGRAVDKEMVYKSAVEAVPPDMPEMKEKVREYLDSFFNHLIFIFDLLYLRILYFGCVPITQYL